MSTHQVIRLNQRGRWAYHDEDTLDVHNNCSWYKKYSSHVCTSCKEWFHENLVKHQCMFLIASKTTERDAGSESYSQKKSWQNNERLTLQKHNVGLQVLNLYREALLLYIEALHEEVEASCSGVHTAGWQQHPEGTNHPLQSLLLHHNWSLCVLREGGN